MFETLPSLLSFCRNLAIASPMSSAHPADDPCSMPPPASMAAMSKSSFCGGGLHHEPMATFYGTRWDL